MNRGTTFSVSTEEYWAQIPEWILDVASAGAVKLYGILRRYADKTDLTARPSRKTLATRMGFTRPQSVDAPIEELQALGALEIVNRYSDRGDQEANEYLLRSSIPAHVVKTDGPVPMFVLVGDTAAPRRSRGGALKRTGGDAPERTGGSAQERTGGSHARAHRGGTPERTGVVRQSAHKPESPQPESPQPEVIAVAITAPATPPTEQAPASTTAALVPAGSPPTAAAAARAGSGRRRPDGGDEDRFAEFWLAYPRHDDRRRAERAWLTAIRRADPDRIIDGARRYADDPNREQPFTKQPATWLNADAWDNDPLPPRGGSAREGTVDRRNRQIQDMRARLAGAAPGGQPAALPASLGGAR